MKRLLALALLGISSATYGTSQIPDSIVIDGEAYELHSQPLASLLEANPDLEKKLKEFERGSCSASWFGFCASWELVDGTLTLTKLIANPCARRPEIVPLSNLPGHANGRVAASWFSGRIVVPRGELVEYVHMGFESKYERYLVITVEKGKVVEQVEQSEHPGRNL